MKKIFLLLVLSCITPALAENSISAVYLNLNLEDEHEYKKNALKIEDLNISNKDDEEDYVYHPIEYIKNEVKEIFFENRNENSK